LLCRKRHSLSDLEPVRFDTSILVRDVTGEGSDGCCHVPERFDGAVFFQFMDGLNVSRHALAETLAQEVVEIIKAPVSGVLDALLDGFCRRIGILIQHWDNFFEPAIGCSARVTDADFVEIARVANDAVAANVVEQEECTAKRGCTDLRVTGAALGDLYPVTLVCEEYEAIAVARVKNVLDLLTWTSFPNSPGTRQVPVTPSPKRSISASISSAFQTRP
jgi:hypothetical protein